MSARASISVDLDALTCYRQIHGLPLQPVDAQGDITWRVGVARLLDLFKEHNLHATLFVVGRDLEHDAHRELATRAHREGHELANHTYDHFYDLRRRTSDVIHAQLQRCDDAIEATGAPRPVGFRTPGYNLSHPLLQTSQQLGHRYDASVFGCGPYWLAKAAVMAFRELRGEPSRSDRTDVRALRAPRSPYIPDLQHFWRRDITPPTDPASTYWEVPVAVLPAGSFPLIGTSLHLLDAPGLERLWPLIEASFPTYFDLEFHALDFIDADDIRDEPDADLLIARQPDLRIPWQKKRARYARTLSLMTSKRTLTPMRDLFATPKAAELFG
ncbi:polysaccharide deacetylase [Lujinxingia sediminis]|uniref:Polysaccharide deacetylase n=1 Tax=Lujinxingia sediminis TaxID=2480984 RepID=A0ABY0CV59_9DELT|nr:polysaccharide deacetylase family protein [Lujinxingia sediminis]RVU45746.1 polysaccharide deacetylase [Lujinxingia sediminis]